MWTRLVVVFLGGRTVGAFGCARFGAQVATEAVGESDQHSADHTCSSCCSHHVGLSGFAAYVGEGGHDHQAKAGDDDRVEDVVGDAAVAEEEQDQTDRASHTCEGHRDVRGVLGSLGDRAFDAFASHQGEGYYGDQEKESQCAAHGHLHAWVTKSWTLPQERERESSGFI